MKESRLNCSKFPEVLFTSIHYVQDTTNFSKTLECHHGYSGICALLIVSKWIQRVRQHLGAEKAGEMSQKEMESDT